MGGEEGGATGCRWSLIYSHLLLSSPRSPSLFPSHDSLLHVRRNRPGAGKKTILASAAGRVLDLGRTAGAQPPTDQPPPACHLSTALQVWMAWRGYLWADKFFMQASPAARLWALLLSGASGGARRPAAGYLPPLLADPSSRSLPPSPCRCGPLASPPRPWPGRPCSMTLPSTRPSGELEPKRHGLVCAVALLSPWPAVRASLEPQLPCPSSSPLQQGAGRLPHRPGLRRRGRPHAAHAGRRAAPQGTPLRRCCAGPPADLLPCSLA